MKLTPRYVEKPWGRTELPPMFGGTNGKRIGEIWFEGPPGLPLLAKYLFTSERLSIQSHPPAKHECWLILDAEPGATLGLGLKREVGRDELRAAAHDGSIVDLMDWKPVRAGDFYYVPPGTIHAIGAGISLLEFQQNSEITYRLYDYGRPRELHLEEALSVAVPGPYASQPMHVDPAQSAILAGGPPFALVHAVDGASALPDRRRWVLPLEGRVRVGNEAAGRGECLLVEAGIALAVEGRALVGAEGSITAA
jgi:mannose-6-phosphate isomerase